MKKEQFRVLGGPEERIEIALLPDEASPVVNPHEVHKFADFLIAHFSIRSLTVLRKRLNEDVNLRLIPG